MSEAKTPPITSETADGETLYTFGPKHTLNDILRCTIGQAGDVQSVQSLLNLLDEEETTLLGAEVSRHTSRLN